MIYPIELISSLIFLAGLILVNQLKPIIENENKISFRYITLGLSTLALFSIASVLAQQNVFAQIPFLNHPMFFKFIYGIGMITGMTMLLNGISRWLPLYRKSQKYKVEEFKKLEIFKKIEQLLRFESRNPVLLMKALELIVKQYNFSEVGCYLYSQVKKEMTFIGATTKDKTSGLQSHDIQFESIEIQGSIIQENIDAIVEKALQKTKADLILPMVIHKRFLGLVSFYSEESIDIQSRSNLKLLLEVIATKFYDDSKILELNAVTDKNSFLTTVADSIDNSKSIKNNILILKRKLQTELPVDFVSLSYSNNGKFPKYVISENNLVLQDFTNKLRNSNEIEKYVFDNNIPVCISNLGRETDFYVDNIALQSNMKSIVACPIGNNQELLGVLVVGSKKYNAFTNFEIQLISELNSSVSELIRNTIQLSVEKTIIKRQKIKEQLLKSVLAETNSNFFFKNVTDIITKETSASFTRISFLDSDKRFLNSKALSVSDNKIQVTPEDATMMLTLMPSHQNALKKEESNIVNKFQSDFKNFEMELRQIYGRDINQFIIVPISYKNRIVGFITTGFDFQNKHMIEKDLTFIEDIASLVSMHLYSQKKNVLVQKMQSRLESLDRIKDHRPIHNLKSSLSGIIGSVELLKEQTSAESQTNKYISILDRSTQRMKQVFQEELIGK